LDNGLMINIQIEAVIWNN